MEALPTDDDVEPDRPVWIRWEYEDAKPMMPNDLYRAAFRASRVVDGVRMFPYVVIDGQRFWLSAVEA